MLAVAELHRPGGKRIQGDDAGFERFGMSHNGFEVLDTDSYVKLLFNSEVFEIEVINCDRCLQWLFQHI